MNSRERVRATLNHQTPDRIPLDLDTTETTGIQASALARLRDGLGLPHKPIKVWEPFQMLGEIDLDLRAALGIDTIGLHGLNNMFGFENGNWKPWRLFDGTDALVAGGFDPTINEEGDWLIHPKSNKAVPPSARMPKGGFYFDAIVRQEPIDWANIDPVDWAKDMYAPFTDAELEHFRRTADDLHSNTSFAIVASVWPGAFGDIALVPGIQVEHPKGVRDPEEWYMAHAMAPDYIKGIFQYQLEVALKNLELFKQAVGDKITVITVSGTDLGTQRGPLISVKMYRDFYKPYQKQVNDWIHQNTNWKTFFHCCGSIEAFLSDFIEAGVDIINPVQTSAANMDATMLKEKYGDKLVFWGGGIDTQRTLPFGTADEVRKDVAERLQIFGKGGGYVFNTIHNIQAGPSTDNLLALFESYKANAAVS